MATNFNNAAAKDVGTSYSTIYTAPSASNNTAIVFSLVFANKSNYIRYVDIKIQNASNVDKAQLGLSIPIPGGSSLVFPGKISLLASEKLLVKADTGTNIDAFASILENT